MNTSRPVPTVDAPHTIRDVLEGVISELVDMGILWPEAVVEFEKIFILKVLMKSRGNLGRAAGIMGVHRNTLSKKMKEHGIQKGRKGKLSVISGPSPLP
jgi:DNA-binding protein Fis